MRVTAILDTNVIGMSPKTLTFQILRESQDKESPGWLNRYCEDPQSKVVPVCIPTDIRKRSIISKLHLIMQSLFTAAQKQDRSSPQVSSAETRRVLHRFSFRMAQVRSLFNMSATTSSIVMERLSSLAARKSIIGRDTPASSTTKATHFSPSFILPGLTATLTKSGNWKSLPMDKRCWT